jgi:hypothetical protein
MCRQINYLRQIEGHHPISCCGRGKIGVNNLSHGGGFPPRSPFRYSTNVVIDCAGSM